MKRMSLLMLACLCGLLMVAFQLNAQTEIEDQDDFDDVIDAGMNANDDPYVFAFDVAYEVPIGETLTIEDDVIIEIVEDAVITVKGTMETTGAINNGVTIRGHDGDVWGQIYIESNGDAGNGIVSLANTTIQDGGAEDGAQGGLFVLGSDQAADITKLTLTDCTLLNSESDGISVLALSSSVITLDGTEIGSSVVGSEIDECGIRYQGTSIDWLYISGNSSIHDCGGDGIRNESVHISFNADITNTEISDNTDCGICFLGGANNLIWYKITYCDIKDNGSDGVYISGVEGNDDAVDEDDNAIDPICLIKGCNVSDNGDCGIELFMTDDDDEGDIVPFECIDDTTNNNADRDGIRMDECIGVMVVSGCVSKNNAQRGVYYDSDCGDGGSVHAVRIWDNLLESNGWEGSYTLKGHGITVPVSICGNVVKNNATDPNVNNDPLEGANIRLEGQIRGTNTYDEITYPTEIKNNIIIGAEAGIGIEEAAGVGVSEFVYSGNIEISNNIQYSADLHGLYIEYYDDDEGDETFIYNNLFYDNGNTGIYLVNDGMTGDQIRNNILAENTTYGIRVPLDPNGDPDYQYNCFDDNGTDRLNCDATIRIDSDPLFASPATGDFHLRWNSPCINRGNDGDNPRDEDWDKDAAIQITVQEEADLDDIFDDLIVNRDGSRTDIGAYGGPNAQDWEFDPYCAINTGFVNVSNNNLQGQDDDVFVGYPGADDGFEALEWDYYLAFTDYNVPENQTLDIDPCVHIENKDDVKFSIDGCLDANGDWDGDGVNDLPLDDDLEHEGMIYFLGYRGQDGTETAEIWDKMFFDQDADLDTEMDWVYVADPVMGANVFTTPVENEGPITFTHCVFTNCQQIGVNVYDSKLTMSGSQEEGVTTYWPVPNRVDLTQETVNTVVDERGIYVSSCDADEVKFEETISRTNGRTDANGNENHAGVLGFLSGFTLDDATIYGNAWTGLSLMGGSPTITGDAQGIANDIKENGVDADEEDENGAEIYLCYGGYGTYNYMDCVDETAGSILVYKDSTSPNGITFDHCWWGDANPAAARFEDEGQTAITLTNNEAAEVDSHNDFLFALELMRQGELEQARQAFTSLIGETPNSSEATMALQYLLGCVSRTDNAGLNRLMAFYDSVIERDYNNELTFQAKLLVPRVYMRMGNYESAMSAYDYLYDNDQDAVVAQFARICYLEYQLARGENHLDDAKSQSALLGEIDEMKRNLLQLANTDSRENLPSEYTLDAAYPNPFNNMTRINYAAPENAHLSISIFDMNGRFVENILDENVSAGYHSVTWNAINQPTGIYFCRMSGRNTSALKLMLVK